MEDKVCLEINIPADYIVPQFMCFPMVIVRADPLFRNWYYQNYMMPVARLDGENSLTCDIADAITYGAGANIYNKVIRTSSIGKTACAQFSDIISVLKGYISKKYYCVLFLDFYKVSCAETYYGKHHFIHEILFYGYDNTSNQFFCYGYFERLYRQFLLPYGEAETAFKGALQYIETMNGWEEHMLITMQRYDHRAPSPYPGGLFLEKLEAYVKGNTTEQFQYDNLMYLKPSETSVSCAGRGVTGIFLEYVGTLEKLSDSESLNEKIDSQITAFNIYKSYHSDIAERLAYFAKSYGIERELAQYISDYRLKVARKSSVIRILYIKFLCLVEKNLSVKDVLGRIRDELSALDRYEEEILNGFLNASRPFLESGYNQTGEKGAEGFEADAAGDGE